MFHDKLMNLNHLQPSAIGLERFWRIHPRLRVAFFLSNSPHLTTSKKRRWQWKKENIYLLSHIGSMGLLYLYTCLKAMNIIHPCQYMTVIFEVCKPKSQGGYFLLFSGWWFSSASSQLKLEVWIFLAELLLRMFVEGRHFVKDVANWWLADLPMGIMGVEF